MRRDKVQRPIVRDAQSLLDGASELVGAIEALLRSLEGRLRADYEALRADWREVGYDIHRSALREVRRATAAEIRSTGVEIGRATAAEQQGRLSELDALDRGNGEQTTAR